ncbi:MAG: sulfite reductase flavoprotein subunit alpha [Limisphaerales bacterium]
MNPPRFVPVVPDSAPFTAEQRAWLNGYLAGLFSYALVPGQGAVTPSPQPTPALTPLAVLVGSQTGTAEKLAKRIAKTAAQRGFAPVIHDLAKISPSQVAAESAMLVIASTYGDGEPPDNAKAFWQDLRNTTAPRLEKTRFSVCALGDTNYPRFCQFGKDLDARFEALGGQRVHPRQDCDVEFEQPFATWLSAALERLAPAPSGPAFTGASPVPGASQDSGNDDEGHGQAWHRDRPYAARLSRNHRLTGNGSQKDVRHFEIDLGSSGIPYEAGDALGVWPANDPDLVQQLLQALGFDGEEAVPDRLGNATPIRQALLRDYDITRIPRALLSHFAQHTHDAAVRDAASPEANGALEKFLRGRDVLDLVLGEPSIRFTPTEFVALLRKIQPRLYSIASSPRLHPASIHLCVSVVRYESLGRSRLGLASAGLADRTGPEDALPVFVHPNPAFRPPPPDRGLIMIGPGTGIAPFRAFLQDRQAQGGKGPNWLFFGDQHESTDFLYRTELEEWASNGTLQRLDLAWSRDTAAKVYVQHRMLENAATLWEWIESGAGVFVCGDASRMAKDVDAALHQVIEQAGGKSPDQAADYVKHLVSDRRYCRDVY